MADNGLTPPLTVDREPERRLPRLATEGGGPWLLGVHGGAGVTSLIRAGVPGVDAHGSWPAAADVVLVCRSNAYGLRCAREAAVEHHRGYTRDVRLVGLVIVADAPKLSGWLRGEARLVGGGFPRRWRIPWDERWRHTADGELPASPPVTDLIRELSVLSLTPEGVLS